MEKSIFLRRKKKINSPEAGKMKNNMMKKAMAILLAATITIPNCAVLAEENTQMEADAEAARAAKAEAEKQAAEAAAKAEAEKQAAEAAAKAEAERQAAEAAAKAEAEKQAAEAAAKAEAERQAAEAAQAEAERQAAEATQTEAATEEQSEAATEAPAEIPSEAATEKTAETEKAEKETEKEYQTSFEFENEEVVIKVKVSKDAKLSKGTKMTAKKLEAGSEKYEAAKTATVNSLGTDEEGIYRFYDIRFEKDGAELDVNEEHMDIQVTFKDASAAVQVKDGAAKRI